MKTKPVISKLQTIAAEHLEAVSQLQSEVVRNGDQPAKSSGAWGTFAAAVTATATSLGDKTILKALKEGEEHGLNDYVEALKGDDLLGSSRPLVTGLVERQKTHIAALDALMTTLH